MCNRLKGLLKPNKIAPIVPFLAFLLSVAYFSPALAQDEKELVEGQSVPLKQQDFNYGDLKIKVTPELLFDPDVNTNGIIVVKFKADWFEILKSGELKPAILKNETIFIIYEKTSFLSLVDKSKSTWNIKNKIEKLLQNTFGFSPDGVASYPTNPSINFFNINIDALKLNLIQYPSQPITMRVTFFLGKQAEDGKKTIDDVAMPLNWAFRLPAKLSKGCKEKYNIYVGQMANLNPKNNNENFKAYRDKEDQTQEEFDKIERTNDEIKDLSSRIKTDIEGGCSDLKTLLDSCEKYYIPPPSLDLVRSSIKKEIKDKKQQEEEVTTVSTSLAQNFASIQVLYRELLNLKWESLESKNDIKVILDDKKASLKQIKQSGNASYEALVANQMPDDEKKLIKKGFDRFCSASEALLTSLEEIQTQIKSGTIEDQQAPGKKKGGGWISALWYIIPSLLIIILAIVLVKYWGTIMQALSIKKKVNS